ncbi:hypothetical protein EXIGLDRAFT_758623 [Exidia glandulosa HHB12029]|uniref:Uncharacterized protein n=1 Tax=Exidia glandulosa HHB12029 TaxID=1314781 RepID=A0A165R0P4_EXIGL|nr:hypothetical protein EXIGLDRAFT_758623 [Exidia glandulosa HHB12029]
MSEYRDPMLMDVIGLISLAITRTNRYRVDRALLALRALNREARYHVAPMLRLRLTLPASHLARRALADAAASGGGPWKHIVTMDLGAHAEHLAETLSIACSGLLPNLEHMCIYARVGLGMPAVDPLTAIQTVASMSRLTTLGLEFSSCETLDASLLVNALVGLPGVHLSLSTGGAEYTLPPTGLRSVCLGTLRLDAATFDSLDRCGALRTLTDVTGIALVESNPDFPISSGWDSPARQGIDSQRALSWLSAPSVAIPYAERLVYFCLIVVDVSPQMAAAVGELVALETLLWHPCTDRGSFYTQEWMSYARDVESRPTPTKFIEEGQASSWLGVQDHAQFNFLLDNVLGKLPRLAALHIGLHPRLTDGWTDEGMAEDMWARASAHGLRMTRFKTLQIGLAPTTEKRAHFVWYTDAEVERRVMPFTYTHRVDVYQTAYVANGLHGRDMAHSAQFDPFAAPCRSRLSEW